MIRRMIIASLLMGCSHAAIAQENVPDDQASGLSEIIVTATRRETNVQDISIAISAISGESLRNSGIVDPRQLSGLAPNLNVDQGVGNGATHVSIRGLASTDFGLGASSPVATYIDDVYQPFQFGIGTQIFDLNRIEVLRGPQGTLFGKNTTGGALNYYSQTPTKKEEGYFQINGGGGDFGLYSVEGAYNKPLSNTLAMRASFRVAHRDDYVDNLLDGGKLGHYDSYNGRLQFAWTPSADTTVNLKLFALSNHGDGPVYLTIGADPLFPPNSRQTYSDVPTFENFHNYGATLKIDQSFGDYDLTSITAYQRGEYAVGTNDDGVGFDVFHSLQSSKTWQASQELRLATPVNQPLRAVLGLFGQYDRISAVQGSAATNVDPAAAFVVAGPAVQKTTTLAAFGSVTYDVTDRFSLIGGLRYSYERKKIAAPLAIFAGRPFVTEDIDYDLLLSKYPFDPATDYLEENFDKHSWKRLTWDATANFKPTDDVLLYVKAATGFRSGGYPVGVTAPGAFVRLDPESVRSYEAGFKTEWFDRKLRVNGSVFLMNYKDMQVQTPRTDGAPGLVLSNAGSSRVKGAELEVQIAPATGLTLGGSLGFNDAKYRRFDVQTGNTLPYAPRWTGNVSLNYEMPVNDAHSITLGTDWNYRSRIYFDPYQLAITSDKSRFVGNARIGFGARTGVWQLSAYVNNLTNLDMKAFGFALDAASGFAPSIYAPKRTWGIQAAFKF